MIPSRQDLIDAVEQIRKTCCKYLSGIEGGFCDCKFGMADFGKNTGEQTGCPELRMVVRLLETMSDETYSGMMGMEMETAMSDVDRLTKAYHDYLQGMVDSLHSLARRIECDGKDMIEEIAGESWVSTTAVVVNEVQFGMANLGLPTLIRKAARVDAAMAEEEKG